jgi:hypothetical protein
MMGGGEQYVIKAECDLDGDGDPAIWIFTNGKGVERATGPDKF